MRKGAVAVPGSIALEHQSAREVVGNGIGSVGPELNPSVVDFVAIRFLIPAQAVIQSQLAANLPRVLDIESPSLLAELRIRDAVDVGCVPAVAPGSSLVIQEAEKN